jgi:hypothetical protein
MDEHALEVKVWGLERSDEGRGFIEMFWKNGGGLYQIPIFYKREKNVSWIEGDNHKISIVWGKRKFHHKKMWWSERWGMDGQCRVKK